MIDLEKVIAGLESQLDDLSKYADVDEVLTLTQGQVKDLLALLKEQEPVEPSVGDSNEPVMYGSWWYRCGKCKMPIDYGDRFCRRCGQAVKWE